MSIVVMHRNLQSISQIQHSRRARTNQDQLPPLLLVLDIVLVLVLVPLPPDGPDVARGLHAARGSGRQASGPRAAGWWPDGTAAKRGARTSVACSSRSLARQPSSSASSYDPNWRSASGHAGLPKCARLMLRAPAASIDGASAEQSRLSTLSCSRKLQAAGGGRERVGRPVPGRAPPQLCRSCSRRCASASPRAHLAST